MEFTKNFYKTENNEWYIDLPEWVDNDIPLLKIRNIMNKVLGKL